MALSLLGHDSKFASEGAVVRYHLLLTSKVSEPAESPFAEFSEDFAYGRLCRATDHGAELVWCQLVN
jgi:hypothetical protein